MTHRQSKNKVVLIGSAVAAIVILATAVLFVLPLSAFNGQSNPVADVTFTVTGTYNTALLSWYSPFNVNPLVTNYHQQSVLSFVNLYQFASTYDIFPSTHVITVQLSGVGTQTMNVNVPALTANYGFSVSCTFHNVPAGTTYHYTVTTDIGIGYPYGSTSTTGSVNV